MVMLIARPEFKRQRCRRQFIVGAAAIVFELYGVSKLDSPTYIAVAVVMALVLCWPAT